MGAFVGAADIDGEDTGAPAPTANHPPTFPHTPRWPLLLTGKLWSKMVCN